MDYQRALEVAVKAAQAAGDLLRAEFHQPGGPRGTTGKAPIDAEAEWTIRKLLLEAFPSCGYLGEETGEQRPARNETHYWLVDPNDGTAEYQKGLRGSAISIGLLREGTPVLGVVYAFAAPDDEGDLLAWAEGCGPLRRNGTPVERERWPRALGSHDVVLLAPGAGKKPGANALVVAPARFRAAPSIAYRLALAAAGDGDGAASLHSPGGWDYAGGHALLRAVGGELVDQLGKLVYYSASGHSQTRFCFGGGPEVVSDLAQREWQDLLRAPDEPEGEYQAARLEPGRNVADAGLLARGHGCLLGQLAGDALGSLVEFQSPTEIAQRHRDGIRRLVDGGHWDTIAGQPTDDSELALMLARSIVQAGKYDPEAAARAYYFWYDSKPFDVGGAISRAMVGISRKSLSSGLAAATARKAADPASQANGSLMRLSPLGIWGHRLAPQRLAAHARADAALTHPHPVCQEAAAVFAIALAHAIAKGGEAEAVYEHALAWTRAYVTEPSVRKALTDAGRQPPADYTKMQGWVLIALQNAFYQLVHAPSFEEGVVRTVMAGGDTDTNAAIAGALLGAVHGRRAVPAQWQRMVLSCRPIERLPGIKNPRPRPFWPVDALDLAERLLLSDSAPPAAQPR